jgi:hypothetical protein
MKFTTIAGAVASGAAACLLGTGLGACAAPAGSAGESSVAVRVMVKLARSSEDADAIAAEASRIAGIRVTHAAATSSSWHALAVHCASPAQCDEAIARMRAAGAVYAVVETEGRKARSGS